MICSYKGSWRESRFCDSRCPLAHRNTGMGVYAGDTLLTEQHDTPIHRKLQGRISILIFLAIK